MIPLVALPVAPHTMLALLQFIEQSHAPLTPDELADEAIHAWLESRRMEAERPALPVLRGYQWKSLFLPEGTRLRVWCRSENGYAEVIGDGLMYDSAEEPEDDGFGNPLPVRHGRLASHVLSSGYTEGRRGNVADRRDPNAPLDRREY